MIVTLPYSIIAAQKTESSLSIGPRCDETMAATSAGIMKGIVDFLG